MTQQNDASGEVVEQRHRDAAADLIDMQGRPREFGHVLRIGGSDTCGEVQAFARFERTHLAQPNHAGASREEIAAIVELAKHADGGGPNGIRELRGMIDQMARLAAKALGGGR